MLRVLVLNFGVKKQFLEPIISNFDEIITQFDFPKEYYGAKWGVHDEYILERFFNDIEKEANPFFNTLFTLSSHEPFDVPETIIEGKGAKSKILNSCAYTDKHLGIFMEKLKASSVWKNTIVIITADHGSRFVYSHKETDKQRYHIPMIWTGGAINKTGTISKYGSQTDIIATLLHQLEQPAEEFIFSKNLLSSGVEGFSYYTYKGGCGYIDNDCYQVYDNNAQDFLINEGDNNEINGRIYLQKSFDYFLDK